MKESASLREIEGEIRRFLISRGIKVAELDPVVAPNLRLELGDFSTDAPLRLLKAGVKGAEHVRAVAELMGSLEALGCQLVQEAESSPGSTGGLGYLNFKVSCLGAEVSRLGAEGGGSLGFRIVVVPPTAGLESRIKTGQVEVEAGSVGEAGARAGCNGASYLRTVARALVQALLLKGRYPGVALELFIGEQQVAVDGLDAKRAGSILLELARGEGGGLQGISQERALAVLEAKIQPRERVETHVWLSAHSFLPELFKRFFSQHGGQRGSKTRFHFSAASWDEASGIAEIPQEVLVVEQEVAENVSELGVGLLWCAANERGAADFDWYSGVLAEWDNLVWATQVVERRLERWIVGQGAKTSYTPPEHEELRAVLLRSLTLPVWWERAALLGDVENFMMVWRDWLNKANRFLNQPATGALPKEWHDIVPSLNVGLSVTMGLTK